MSLPTSVVRLGPVLICCLLAGCSNDKPVAETPQPETPGESTAKAAAPVGVTPKASPAAEKAPAMGAVAEVSASNFELKLQPVGAFSAGTEGQLEIALVAKKPFKCNDEYPYKFELQPTEGVKFASMVVLKDAAQIAKERVTMKVSFTPETAGRKRIAGKFKFSVCTEDKCLIEKRELALDIDVK